MKTSRVLIIGNYNFNENKDKKLNLRRIAFLFTTMKAFRMDVPVILSDYCREKKWKSDFITHGFHFTKSSLYSATGIIIICPQGLKILFYFKLK